MVKALILSLAFPLLVNAQVASGFKTLLTCKGVKNPLLRVEIVDRKEAGKFASVFLNEKLVGANSVGVSRNSKTFFYDGREISISIPLGMINNPIFPAFLHFNGKDELLCSR